MRQYIKAAFLALVCCTILFAACKKDPKAGKGGKAVLKITPRHHSQYIDSCTIYIKYGVSDLPADLKFDDSAKCVQIDSMPVAIFTNLHKGNYYLYGAGYDPNIVSKVVGGSPYTIKEETEQSYTIPVTEGD